MSYLDVPRLHFAGTFSANPSTLNNLTANFDPANYNNLNPLWNQNGNHAWRFLNCTVQSAFGRQGRVNQDPVIGAAFTSTNSPAFAKLVDLDPQQQGVSQIWGLRIKVAVSPTEFFMGDFRVNCFNDLWGRVVGLQGMRAFGAYWQTVLDNVTWGQIHSPFLKELQTVSPARLSIKFNVDGYQPDSALPTFTQGRVVGTVGPAFADEPPNFVLGRALRAPASAASNPYFGYARVDPIRQKLLVDLGNSIPTASPGGAPPADFGTLQLAVGPSGRSPVVLGEYDYSLPTYQATAGVQEFSLTAEQLDALADTPLGVVRVPGQGGGGSVYLQEGQDGTYVCADRQFCRMNPGDVEVVELFALKFGRPAAGQKIGVQLNGNLVGPTPPPVGTPESALSVPASVKTDDDGRASFPMTAGAPGNPRQFIDGQVYGVAYGWDADDDRDFPPDPNNFVSVLVFDSLPAAQKEPTWENVKPVLTQYAELYPFMDGIFQLDDPAVIRQHLAAFQQVLNIPVSDPRYMPVTRDMSRDKRQLILDWLALGAPVPAAPAAKAFEAAPEAAAVEKPEGPDTYKAPRPAGGRN